VIFSKMRSRFLWAGAGLITFYALLLIPAAEPVPGPLAPRQAFVWNQDERWEALEASFAALRPLGCAALQARLDSGTALAKGLIFRVSTVTHEPNDTLLRSLESSLFAMAPVVAVCPGRAREYLDLVARMRSVLKDQSLRWDMNDMATRHWTYRLLYGGRAATEEVLLQAPKEDIPPLMTGDDEPSQTPEAEVLGVRIHSGDILVSRGGAPTSALIARGNDYPGNFSHVGLVHVDPETHVPRVIESHIERGVVVSSLRQYLEDTKLRIMVLRLRSDMPAIVADPELPRKAAELALTRARQRHIPYDFAMDVRDTTGMFCSEVVSSAYGALGVKLWMGMSSISTPGVAGWLAGFGVRHFETQEPSDLEYDPQLRVVAEWRDPDALLKDHIDNAVIDALLEGAEAGERIPVRWYLLPVTRVVKFYSIVLNLMGKVGPIPEGMASTPALRHLWLVGQHDRMRNGILRRVEKFRRENGYTPPYWELLKMARDEKRQPG
jgi:hypothetical protein